MGALAVPYRELENDDQLAEQTVAPIVAAVDSSAASWTAIGEAVRLGAELDAPIVFAYVRRGPAGFLGTPLYQRQLTKEMSRARHALDRALAVAASAGVLADAEILEGLPRRRIREFARDRGARVVVVGSRTRKRGRRSHAASSAWREERLSSPNASARARRRWSGPSRTHGR